MSHKRLVLVEGNESIANTVEEYWVPEFFDFVQVFPPGATKHGKFSWLGEEGGTCSHKDMHASMFRHLAESYAGKTTDAVSGLHPLLHLATRALMCYTRERRGLQHPDDSKEPK